MREWVHWDAQGSKPVHRERQPDLPSVNHALAQQAKILGLFAPEHREIVLASLSAVASDIVAVALRMIPEDRRDEFLERCDETMREKMKLEAGGEEIIDVPLGHEEQDP